MPSVDFEVDPDGVCRDVRKPGAQPHRPGFDVPPSPPPVPALPTTPGPPLGMVLVLLALALAIGSAAQLLPGRPNPAIPPTPQLTRELWDELEGERLADPLLTPFAPSVSRASSINGWKALNAWEGLDEKVRNARVARGLHPLPPQMGVDRRKGITLPDSLSAERVYWNEVLEDYLHLEKARLAKNDRAPKYESQIKLCRMKLAEIGSGRPGRSSTNSPGN